ncbi:helix-turn-helix domain-containing protein [Phormidium sp. CCY1219]|nr:helix-turn-helix domain-containing protein [Phormidium sp. CCY1219]MEB3826820.1 helix-turn-helix domain-containing protein [Phormidium sp. CCY1219]
MQIAYQYRLKPTFEQRCRMSRWIDMLRFQSKRRISRRTA